MSEKFSASQWKDNVDKDIVEIKKAIYEIYGFINTFEQWRRLPFNKEADNAKHNNSKAKISRKQKRKSNKNNNRQHAGQNQRA